MNWLEKLEQDTNDTLHTDDIVSNETYDNAILISVLIKKLRAAERALMDGSEIGGVFWRENAIAAIYADPREKK